MYNLTEKLRRRFVDNKVMAKAMRSLLEQAWPHISETLPASLIEKFRLVGKREAVWNIHLPQSPAWLRQAERRLKFEELFYNQLRLIANKLIQKEEHPGQVFTKTALLAHFYKTMLPFPLTGAQQRVLREIHKDCLTGRQMNRLLQGDVGSGKTIVAFITMLLAIDNGAQACLMAPTEILADQHYNGLKPFADAMGLNLGILTGSTKTKRRRVLHDELLTGRMHILVGTHALLEDIVQFRNLGLCIIDEQHRFGVAQRAKMWAKNPVVPPHILVMTATPIPRTLAMTLYGNLDISIIDEMPAGRKPIKTVHKYDKHRAEVFGFMRQQIELGRQVYVVYPLIEESETLDYKDLTDGHEGIERAFPKPDYQVGILHGKMDPYSKDYEMTRFAKGETHILVATTVIEVGVNVPNASVMVIESAERFGLSQLHQLRGRVGRGTDQSYCVLMTGYKLSADTKTRLETMVRTNNGFEIADVDLQLRGPGDLAGTQQSGLMDLRPGRPRQRRSRTDGSPRVSPAHSGNRPPTDPPRTRPHPQPHRRHRPYPVRLEPDLVMEPVPSRRSVRLPEYDYASAGSYFITICTQHKEHRFGHVAHDEMILNEAGLMIEERILAIPDRFPTALIDSQVVMPNHIHFIITLLDYVPVSTGITHLDGNDDLGVDPVGAAHRARPLSDANAAADTPDIKNNAPGVDAFGNDDVLKSPITSGPVGPKAGGHDGPPLHGNVDSRREPISLDENVDSQSQPPNLSEIIGWFKASSTNYYIKGVKEGYYPPFDRRLWQRNYYEHIIRTDAAYKLIDEYIQTNPQRWAEDRLR